MNAKVALVTGGSRGIGAAVVRRLAQQGWRLAISYRERRDAADALLAALDLAPGRAIAVAADVALEPDVLRLFGVVDATFGRLDALVNNAGIVAPASRLDAMSAARIERVFATNVVGSLLCAREAVRRMSTRQGGDGGVIVNLSSAAARLGSPAEYVDYAASKGAIDTMTLGLAKELAADGIRVNAVRPGLIHTDIHASGGEPDRVERLAANVPMGRGGTADEVAAAIVWLLSDDASYASGAIVDITGGR